MDLETQIWMKEVELKCKIRQITDDTAYWHHIGAELTLFEQGQIEIAYDDREELAKQQAIIDRKIQSLILDKDITAEELAELKQRAA